LYVRTNMGTFIMALIGMAAVSGVMAAGPADSTASPDVRRFFFAGDGQISLVSEKSGESFAGRYRLGRGRYDDAAIEAICRVFGAPHNPQPTGLSLRLIEYLDFLEDRLCPGGRITICSGYRNPEYNRQLRDKGALAAEASLHQYGMAADLKMDGVPARRLWDYAKTLGFGGAGYYHGDLVHVDVGPARSWDEQTSGVGTGISDHNKLIGLVTDYDVYLPGEAMALRFIRMTAFPIGVVSEFALDREIDPHGVRQVAVFEPSFAVSSEGECRHFGDIPQMASIRWRLQGELPPGRYRVRARFCDNPWNDMPMEVSTPEFEIVRP
jgi:uncharacterized protein YcbK (DUF882 family)